MPVAGCSLTPPGRYAPPALQSTRR